MLKMHHYTDLLLSVVLFIICFNKSEALKACVAKTKDLEVQGSSLACRVVSSDKEPYSTLSLFTQVYKWVPATYFWGLTL